MFDWKSLKNEISDKWTLHYNHSVQVLLDDGENHKALLLSNKKVKKWPKHADSWKGKADALYELERYRESILAYDKALKYCDSFSKQSIIYGKMWAHHDADEFSKAIECANRLLKTKKINREYSENQLLYLKADCLHHLEKYDEALKIFQKLVKEDPDDAQTIGSCAEILVDLKKYKDAEPLIDKLMQLDPEDPKMFVNKSFIGLVTKDYKKALDYSKKGLTMVADDDILANLWYNKASAEFWLGKYNEADKSIMMALGLDSDESTTWMMKAGITAKKMKLNPKDPLPRVVLDDLYVATAHEEIDEWDEDDKEFLEEIQPGLTKLLSDKVKMV